MPKEPQPQKWTTGWSPRVSQWDPQGEGLQVQPPATQLQGQQGLPSLLGQRGQVSTSSPEARQGPHKDDLRDLPTGSPRQGW